MERGAAIGGMGPIAGSRAGASSGGGGFPRIWDPTRYNLPGSTPIDPGDSSNASLSGAGDLLWGVPIYFGAAGHITAILNALGNPTNGTGDAFCSFYTFDSANPIQPGALVHGFRCKGQSFGGVYEETGLSIAVATGFLWLVTSGTGTPFVDAYNGGAMTIPSPSRLPFTIGSHFVGASPNAPGMLQILGLKKARVYAWPPPDPFPAVVESTDLILNTSTLNVPIFAFKFAPT